MKNIKFSSLKKVNGNSNPTIYTLKIPYPVYDISIVIIYFENMCDIIVKFYKKGVLIGMNTKCVSCSSKHNDKPFRIAKKIIKSKILN